MKNKKNNPTKKETHAEQKGKKNKEKKGKTCDFSDYLFQGSPPNVQLKIYFFLRHSAFPL